MKYTIRGYAIKHRLTVQELFVRAWEATQSRGPGSHSIPEDVKYYAKYGAIPRYVAQFLEEVSSGTAPVFYKVPTFRPVFG